MIRLSELSLPLDHPESALRDAIVQRLNLVDENLLDFFVFKRSYDARKKNTEITFVYIIHLHTSDDEAVLARFEDDVHVKAAPDIDYHPVAQAPAELTERRL